MSIHDLVTLNFNNRDLWLNFLAFAAGANLIAAVCSWQFAPRTGGRWLSIGASALVFVLLSHAWYVLAMR